MGAIFVRVIEKIKNAWSEVTIKEIMGWFIFTCLFSLVMMKSTLFWEMGRDKLEVSYLIYKFVMTVFFVSITGLLMRFAMKWKRQKKNMVTEQEMIRVLTGQLLFGSLLVLSLLLDSLSMSIRGSQSVEYLQGFLYFGVCTGFGMMFYVVSINHIPKKERETCPMRAK